MIHANILVVMGSIRAGRRCHSIATWVLEVAATVSDLKYELVDLADWPLPMDDEPGIPALGDYRHPHTRAWSRKIAGADALLFVTPQYNWGYPAVLKNAIDHVYDEWRGKPAVIITYGGHGGSKCAAQLRQVLDAIEMRTVTTMPAITLSRSMIGGGPMDPAVDFMAAAEEICQAIRELAVALEHPLPERH